MDNVTHALAGCLLAAGTIAMVERRGVQVPNGFRKAAVVVGIVAAELPDSDLLYAGPSLGMGKLGYLLHHRGHTHTVVFAVVSALLVWFATLALSKQSRSSPLKGSLLVLALLGTLSHLLLDFTNNYGIHPFWPVYDGWYYGDAIFIVEPWFWVLSIPVLYSLYQRVLPRVLLGLLLVAILAAAWGIGMVEREVAVALTIVVVLWSAVVRSLSRHRRVFAAIAAWFAIEAMFFTASSRARDLVRTAGGETSFRDVALTPFIGNPLCFNALVMEQDGAAYRVSSAVVATASSIRPANRCASSPRGDVPGNELSAHAVSSSVRWGNTWSAPLADLSRIARENCEVAAALQFIRVPIWHERQDGSVEIGDIRFGATGGFAGIAAPVSPAKCPKFIPGWIPPRAEMLKQ